MANHEIETQWMGKMQFNSLINGHTVVMDAPVRSGGEEAGPIPKPLVLAALSGCTGMDIIALLRKTGITVNNFEMKATGELSKQQPMQYISIHIVYDFTASEDVKQSVLDAVTASQEQYCGVSSMLKKAIPVTWEINLNRERLFSNQPTELISS